MTLELKEAFEVLSEAIKADPEYAWSWHCNIAMPAFHANVPYRQANEAAANVMQHLFGVDMKANTNYQTVMKLSETSK